MKIFLLILSLLFSNLVVADTPSNKLILPQNHFAILPINVAPHLLEQCSRETPTSDSFWLPEQSQIIQLEGLLAQFINHKKENAYNTPIPQAYDRQFIGIVQNGEKLIYGNFFPSRHSKKPHKLSEIIDLCDGFGTFWGVIYNPSTQQFSQLKINGLTEKRN